ncbi:outer membrane beta-barrel protein [Mangrovibacterium sp.]|uniref:outer membrane beta-barrel protein n=1 Tax=Mangrovibacterium sp. TaxID=1961364 RepID=UPI0035633553
MRKIFLFMLPLFAALLSMAQPAAKDFMVSVDGNYFKTKSTETIADSKFKTEEKSLNFSLSVERMLTRRFSVGLSLARYWDDGEASSSIYSGNELSMTVVETEANYWMPRVFCKYYLPVSGRFYVVPHLKTGYTKVEQELVGFQATATELSGTELELVEATGSTLASYGAVADLNYLDLELAPELVCFFAEHWGVSVYAGGLRYEKVSGDLEDSDWTFSFKPKYWRLGVNFTF